jgi:UDP-N-acetylglucosamine 1-carboxyvinyltransferase
MTASGAKNAALPVMAACLLASGDIHLRKIPGISDVWVMKELLESLGAVVDFDGSDSMRINAGGVHTTRTPHDLVKRIHASFDVTGPLLARFHRAEVSLPGGCVLGSRQVDLHTKGFMALGAKIDLGYGFYRVEAKELNGTRIFFDKPSVGATKNVMMAACLARGKTLIENAAREPEVGDLANFLNAMGARISGIGSADIKIEGVRTLHPPADEYEIISDRIESGTFLLAAAITGGSLLIEDISPQFLDSLLQKLTQAGLEIETGENFIRLSTARPIRAVDVTTMPFPGFPTDLQPPIGAVLTTAEGTSIIKETIFDSRYAYVDEMRRMGADIQKIDERTILVKGVRQLTGAPVVAMDIRAGAALVLAGLAADGQTEIGGLKFIDRGYENISEKLRAVGADITRSDDKE